MRELLLSGDVPESRVAFDLPDTGGLQIEGRLVGTIEGPLVVGLHGMPGDSGELMPHVLGQALYAQGFNSLWLDLYNYNDKTRDFRGCTLDTHVEDFSLVIDKLAEAGVEDIYATGHSAGGLVLLMSKVALKGAAIIDGSHGSLWKGFGEKPQRNLLARGDYYVSTGGRGTPYPAAMARQMATLGDTTMLAADKDYPLKFITAGNGVLTEVDRQYHEAANEPKAIHEVPGAGHMFSDSMRVMLELAGQTVQWFVEIENGDIRQDER